MKKRLALLCALTLLVQLVTVPGLMAGAEDIPTHSDLPHVHDGEMSYDDTEHWYACEECGTDAERDVHYAKCTNPTACLVCKAKVVTMSSIWHNFDVRHYSDTECWDVCLDCGEEIDRQQHIADCTDPDVYVNCGQTGVTAHVAHWGEREIQYNNTECWEVCKDCGSEMNCIRHYGACGDPTTCLHCKQTGVTVDDVQHSYVQKHDAKTHWYACEVCGDTIVDQFDQLHWAYCDTAANTCLGCNATDVTVANVEHQEGTYQHDQLYCWLKCDHCGENYNKDRHWGYCSDEGKCTRCGATGVKLEYIDHEWPEKFEHNATTHWGSCMECGAKVEGLHEAYCDEPTACIDCGGKGVTIEDGLLFHAGCDWKKPEYNDFEHWYTCTVCGENTYAVQHASTCTHPDVCVDCGATGVSMGMIYCSAASKASRNSGQLQVPQAESLSFFTAS